MQLHLKLKTNRTRSGYANATLSRFMNYSTNRINYGFHFYSDCKFFNHHKEMRSYIIERYDVDIGERKDFWGI